MDRMFPETVFREDEETQLRYNEKRKIGRTAYSDLTRASNRKSRKRLPQFAPVLEHISAISSALSCPINLYTAVSTVPPPASHSKKDIDGRRLCRVA